MPVWIAWDAGYGGGHDRGMFFFPTLLIVVAVLQALGYSRSPHPHIPVYGEPYSTPVATAGLGQSVDHLSFLRGVQFGAIMRISS